MGWCIRKGACVGGMAMRMGKSSSSRDRPFFHRRSSQLAWRQPLQEEGEGSEKMYLVEVVVVWAGAGMHTRIDRYAVSFFPSFSLPSCVSPLCVGGWKKKQELVSSLVGGVHKRSGRGKSRHQIRREANQVRGVWGQSLSAFGSCLRFSSFCVSVPRCFELSFETRLSSIIAFSKVGRAGRVKEGCPYTGQSTPKVPPPSPASSLSISIVGVFEQPRTEGKGTKTRISNVPTEKPHTPPHHTTPTPHLLTHCGPLPPQRSEPSLSSLLLWVL